MNIKALLLLPFLLSSTRALAIETDGWIPTTDDLERELCIATPTYDAALNRLALAVWNNVGSRGAICNIKKTGEVYVIEDSDEGRFTYVAQFLPTGKDTGIRWGIRINDDGQIELNSRSQETLSTDTRLSFFEPDDTTQ